MVKAVQNLKNGAQAQAGAKKGVVATPKKPAGSVSNANAKQKNSQNGGGAGLQAGQLKALLGLLGGDAGAAGALLSQLGLGGGAGGATGAGAESGKQLLHQTYAKHHKRCHTAADISYDTNQVNTEGKAMFQSTVTVDGQQFEGESADSKKRAESSAAYAAVQELFPDAAGAVPATNAAAKQKKQQKADAEQHPKVMLNVQVGMALGRPMTKGDIVYETTGSTDTGFTSVCRINEYSKVPFKGQGSSKMDAEKEAADKALKGLKSKLAPLVAKHEAAKSEKRKAGLAKLKESQAAKKAAKA